MKLSGNEKSDLLIKYGEWALITGASSGIGYELASLLADAGFNLILVSRKFERLQEIEIEFIRKYNIKILVLSLDVSDDDFMNKIIHSTKDLNVGLLIASAGYGTSGSFIKSDLEKEKNMVKVNCEALLSCTHYFSKQFALQKRGGIILMSSMVAFQGVPYSANYAATKAYVQSLAEALSIELKKFGVDVLAVAPGPVATNFSTRADMIMSMSMTPSQVGVPILKALGRCTTVLPGLLTKLLVYSLRTVPRWGKIIIMEKVMGRMTKHQEGRSN